jgi:uncharacterized protein (TIGR00375 family)
MKVIADLHIHSRHSRATSKNLDLANLEKYARIKGLNLLGTGDFTHPEWIKEIKSELTEQGNGILTSKTGFNFILQTEISLIYTQDNKGRRIHNVLFAPDLGTVDQITEYLLKHGRIDYDGRPIFKIPCDEFVYELRKINKKIEVIPAHIWTPWFSLFGSMSGYNKVEDCFKDQSKYIHALETGLSSDPAMNWRISSLDKYSLVSFSDLHSYWPWRIGRENTVFDFKELSYNALLHSLKTKEGLKETIEFFPEEGKYHFDGHRACDICLDPADSIKLNNICPKCGKGLTIGVANRIEELADRPMGFKPDGAVPFKSLISLSDLIAGSFGCNVATKKVWAEYNKILAAFKNELEITLEATEEELSKVTTPTIAKLIIKNREQKIKFKPGYDGVYGEPILDEAEEKKYIEKEEKMREEMKNMKPKQSQAGLGDFC